MLLDSFFKISGVTHDNNNLKYQAIIELNPEHPIYEGHFPGNPVVPGVCMQQMVKETLSFILKKDLILSKADNIKFLALIVPAVNNILKLDITVKSSDDNQIKIDSNIADNERVFFKFITTYKIIK